MKEEQIRSEIAKMVCDNFIKLHAKTSRHTILKRFDDLDVLDQMEHRNLLRASDQRNAYQPNIGTFAILDDEDDYHRMARVGFERTIRALRELFKAEDPGVNHEAQEFAAYTNRLNSDEVPFNLVALGLYLATETGVLQPIEMSDDQMNLKRFRVAEYVIKMRDPSAWWKHRVTGSRQWVQAPSIPIEQIDAAPYDSISEGDFSTEPFDQSGFWPLINQKVAAEARPRFEMEHYADAVERALKVVAEEIRRRTGLKSDGAALMNEAFSPKKPCLKFEDPIPDTQNSMQVGYMQIFAGAMTGIRNPKAHGMVHLDRGRCIHFLFLASLLADKIDEAVDASQQGNN